MKFNISLLKILLQLFGTFATEFASIEEQISRKEYPMLLLRNVVKQREALPNTLRIGKPTFIMPLRSQKALNDIEAFLKSTTQVKNYSSTKLCYIKYTSYFVILNILLINKF